MNQENDYDVDHMKTRYLEEVDAEVRLKGSIQKVETDLKERVQKVETDLKERIQKVEIGLKEKIQQVDENRKRLSNRLWWCITAYVLSLVAIIAALIGQLN